MGGGKNWRERDLELYIYITIYEAILAKSSSHDMRRKVKALDKRIERNFLGNGSG